MNIRRAGAHHSHGLDYPWCKLVWHTTVRPFFHRTKVSSSNLWKLNAVPMLKAIFVKLSRRSHWNVATLVDLLPN